MKNQYSSRLIRSFSPLISVPVTRENSGSSVKSFDRSLKRKATHRLIDDHFEIGIVHPNNLENKEIPLSKS